MKIRVYKIGDEVVIDCPSERYQGDISKCPHPGRFRRGEPFEMEVKELSELEQLTQGTNEAGGAQYFYDGKTLKHDNDWSELLMPTCVIRKKQLRRFEDDLNGELAKETPDPIATVRLWKKIKEWESGKVDDREIYQAALDNIIKGGINKPKIVTKLQEKLK